MIGDLAALLANLSAEAKKLDYGDRSIIPVLKLHASPTNRRMVLDLG